MKVMMLVSELEDYTISFVNGVAQHVPVLLGVPRRRYGHLAPWFDPSVDLRLLDWPRHRSPANPRFLFELTRLVRREAPSVIHMLSNSTLWFNLAAPFWRPIPLVTTVHDVELHPGDSDSRVVPRWATNLMARQSDHLVVHGNGLRSLAVTRYAKPLDHVHVLSHPAIQRYADLAKREGMRRRPEDGTFRVLLFGRIFAYKGLETLVEAEALLKGRLPGLRVVIAGRGDDPHEFRPLMGDPSRYDIRNRFIEDIEVAQLFLDADLVVLPYTEASQSGVLNLAAAFGTPVVVTDVGELAATVAPNQLGLIVPAGQPEALADAMLTLSRDADLRARLSGNALAWARGPNAPGAVGEKAADLYRKVVQSCVPS
ncbi:glycosyltransferase family 4 protein [Kaistia geumhonensis]|uniref:Glycosyltransferase involved in cell wall biosynthesis n=1 Tax=Kaistia geumhonensis TaxID=410839 RepID=A0ABU0M9D3_9HYPH|nr:glycosyltransferase family 4 protein [Kaistia geumhonensis]MCX5480717.1 glycosyltransferase family 4 protein [Kaistia geumhonensis]MDQ0517579.1 glycosyltransferase involved in cell wall biosynthesis [Kaistia geumhonensis]